MNAIAPEAMPAATLILVRSGDEGPEVLLLKRHERARFMPSAYVFAGGAVDDSDAGEAAYRCCMNLDDARASAQLSVAANGLSFYVGAIRECFEECGILLAYERSGQMVDLQTPNPQHWQRTRTEVSRQTSNLAAVCAADNLLLAVDRLIYYSHWITPLAYHRRFDTRFFMACVPQRQDASLAGEEMQELTWMTPARALAGHRAGALKLVLPTRATLEEIAEFRELETLLAFARRPRRIEPIMPVITGS